MHHASEPQVRSRLAENKRTSTSSVACISLASSPVQGCIVKRGRRQKKRYGPIHKRGIYVPTWLRAEPKPVLTHTFTIQPGTPCCVRKLSSKEPWRPHTTKILVECHGFLWRNEHCYGFARGDYEIKVAVGRFEWSRRS